MAKTKRKTTVQLVQSRELLNTRILAELLANKIIKGDIHL